jgi:hypothetical protein
MSVLDHLSRKQLEQLRADAQNTRAALVIRGWVPGRLIATTGEVCMSGAAGCGVEGDPFAIWVHATDASTPEGFEWAAHSKNLLWLLAEVGTGIYPDDYLHHRELDSARDDLERALERIVDINDGPVGMNPRTAEKDDRGQDRAIAWVDVALGRIETALKKLPAEQKPLPGQEIIDQLLEVRELEEVKQ